MKKIFWDNPYQRELTTKVSEVNGNQVLFEDTIAYSFSGGQESDKATVIGFVALKREHPGKSIGNESRFD